MQWEHRYDPHIASINELVDKLKSKNLGPIPYVDPLYGGIHAKILFLFQDPGPGTYDKSGSGFLSAENDDPSAQLFAQCLDRVGIEINQVITWNAFPWRLTEGQKQPTAKQLETGIEPLGQLIKMLEKLKVVIKMGRIAAKSWERFSNYYPNISSLYSHFSGLHTSRRGITNGGQHSKDEGIKKNLVVMKKALKCIQL